MELVSRRLGWKSVTLISTGAGIQTFEEEPTGATALFIIPVTNPCIAENMIFLCDIITANNLW